MSKKIIFSGGGTGGHIFPAINLMKHFLKKKYKVLIVTDIKGSNFIKDQTEFQSYIIRTGTPTKKNIFKKFLSFFLIFYSILKSFLILRKEKPDLIFGFGGYVSFPLSFASIFFNLPLIIYENNMLLGRTNKYLSSFSKKILVARQINEQFPEKYRKKTHEVGTILNKDIINFSPSENNNEKKRFSILVIGGSQGAEIFGKIIPPVIKMIKETGNEIEIQQQCNKSQKDSLTNFYTQNHIKNYVFEFEKNIMQLALSSSLAITRCGASTTAELVHTSTPFIAVPLPNSIDNHQYLNAKYYEEKGCCWLLKQEDFNTKNLFDLVMKAINDKNKLEQIRENMKKNCNRNVYTNIENEIQEFVQI